MRDVALSFLLCAMSVLGLSAAHLGIMLWIWTALAIPNSYMFGFLTAVPLNKVTVAVAVIAILCDRRRGKFYVDGFILLITLMLAQSILSYNLRITEIARADDVMDRFSKVLTLCYFMTFMRRDRLNFHSLLLIIAISAGIHGVLEGMKYIETLGAHIMQPPSSLGDNNYLALYCLMLCPIVMYLIKYTGSRLVRATWIGALILLVTCVVASSSRGGFLGLLVLGFFVLMQSKRKLTMLVCIGIAATILAVATPEEWRDRMDSISTAAESDSSFLSRVASWEMNTALALDRPLIGGGFSAMENPIVFQEYIPSFAEVNIASLPTPDHPLAGHSIYFQVLGDLGFVGLFFFICIILKSYHSLSWIIKNTRGHDEFVWIYDLARSFRIVLFLYVICGAALSAPYSELAYIIFATISLLRRHVAEQLSSQVGIGATRIPAVAETARRPALAGRHQTFPR